MSARCEPPEELWNKDGFHWVEAPDGKLRILRWLCRDGATTRGWPMSAAGYRYITPVATPTEVAALRAEVERLRGALEEWTGARAALIAFEHDNPGNTSKSWDDKYYAVEAAEIAARAALTHKEPSQATLAGRVTL
jgi:hypothetical protein